MKITKRQLKRIIREEKAKLNAPRGVSQERLELAIDDFIASNSLAGPIAIEEMIIVIVQKVLADATLNDGSIDTSRY